MRQLFLLLLGSSLGLIALGGCLSGQTGSPDCVGPQSCVCDPLYGAGNQLRVRVESLRDGRLRAEVVEVLKREPGGVELAPGDRIEGSLGLAQPCSPEAPLAASEGAELFVLFSPGAGDAPLLDGYFAEAIAWTDPLAFGAMHELPLSELSVLESNASCLERFPAEPAPPCHDTQTVTCSTAPAEPRRSGGGAAWLGLGVVLAAGVLQRTRRRGATGGLGENPRVAAEVRRRPDRENA